MSTNTVLNISDVMDELNFRRNEQRPTYVKVKNQNVLLTKYLLRLKKFKNFECSICGCNGTHFQKHVITVSGSKKQGPQQKEVWRMMTWSNAGQCVSFLNIDHIIPKSLGGTYDTNNIRLTCEYCNSFRGNACSSELIKKIKSTWYLNKKFIIFCVEEFIKTQVQSWTKTWTKQLKQFLSKIHSTIDKLVNKHQIQDSSSLVSFMNTSLSEIEISNPISEEFFTSRLYRLG